MSTSTSTATPAASSTSSSASAATSDAAASSAAPTAPATSAASTSSTSSSASSSHPAAPKKYIIPDVPEGADPLDYINYEKLKEDNKNMPTTKEGIDKMLNEMPLTADVMPEKDNMNTEFHGIQAVIDETPVDARADNFRQSGNEAYKLATRMKKEHKEGLEKQQIKDAELEELDKAGKPRPVLTEAEAKADRIERDHVAKLKESSRKRLIDAIEYYTQALDVESDASNVREDGSKQMLSAHFKAQVFSNRALIHLTMENYGKAQADCDSALTFEPKNAKAAFRGATAALAVHPPKLEKARTYLTAGRVAGPEAEKRKKIDWQFRAEQKSMDDIEKQIVGFETAIREKEEKKKAAELEKIQSLSLYSSTLQQALNSRGLKLGKFVFDFAQSAYAAQTKEAGYLPRAAMYPPLPAAYSSSTRLGWPLLILYPDVLQSDFIQECNEDNALIDILAQMFPPNTDYAPWDEKKKYHLDNLSVWIDVRGPNLPETPSTEEQDQQARMLVNPKQSLRAILSNPKLLKKNYVIPGIPTFIVLPKQ